MAAEILERYTYDDYILWEGDWELIDGVAYAMAPSPVKSHQFIVSEIVRVLGNEIEECSSCLVLSEMDWKIDDFTVVRPDVMFVCEDLESEYIKTTPKIIFEVISPSSRFRDEKVKFDIYKKEGVKYYILVELKELKAKIYKLINGEYIKEGDFFEEEYVFDDLECEVKIDFKKIFKRLK